MTARHDLGFGRKPRWRPTGPLQLLHGGNEYFAALCAAIGSATHEVFVETYIYADDEAGDQVAAALIDAARRGVTVRLVIDWVGTPVLAQRARLEAAGVEVAVFNPNWISRQGFARTHRKLAVVDGETGFVGGINIIDDLRDVGGRRLPEPRWDFALQVGGDVATDIRAAFVQQWQSLHSRYAGALELMRRITQPASAQPPWPGVPQIALVARDNLRDRRTIENAYLEAIGAAREAVWMANPYFAPGWRLRRALVDAAKRGVTVTLLLGKHQFRTLDWAVGALYGRLLPHGIRIAEYSRTQLHGKVAVVDRNWATVGSSNCDALSLFLNHEANLLLREHPLIGALQQQIERAYARSDVVDPQAYARRPLWQRFGNRCAYLLYRIVMKVLTVGRYR